MSYRFIGYLEKSKGYKFNYPNSHTRIQETQNAKFIESTDVVHSSTDTFVFEELTAVIDKTAANALQMETEAPNEEPYDTAIDIGNNLAAPMVTEVELQTYVDTALPQIHPVPGSMPLRKSGKMRKPAISSDYLCFLQESEYDFGDDDIPTTYKQAVESSQGGL